MFVIIGEFKFEVIEADTLIDDKGNQYFGLTEYFQPRISILKGLSDAQKRNTLTHEMTHAFMWAYGFGQCDEMSRELVCEFVGTYAHMIVDAVNHVLGGEQDGR